MKQKDAFLATIRRKREDLEELELFAGVCNSALHSATKALQHLELRNEIASLIGDPPPFPNDKDAEHARERATAVAKFAEKQAMAGSPYLFNLCTVRLWAHIEALVDEIVVEAMRTPGECKDQTTLGKLKGPLVEFLSASADEQAELLAETLKQSVDASLKLGVGRFEAILEPIGLGGAVSERVRKVLFELSQIRNSIVHKSARADRRLIEACPWLSLKNGESVQVSSRTFMRYLAATYWYSVELRGRIEERAGSARPEKVNSALAALDDAIRDEI